MARPSTARCGSHTCPVGRLVHRAADGRVLDGDGALGNDLVTDVGLRVVDSLTVLREDGHGVDDVVAAVGEEAEVVLCTID